MGLFGIDPGDFLPSIKDVIEESMQFKINRHALNFYGKCIDEENCNKKAKYIFFTYI